MTGTVRARTPPLQRPQPQIQREGGAPVVVAGKTAGVEGGVVAGGVDGVEGFGGEGGEGGVEVVVEGRVVGEGEAEEERGGGGGDHGGDEGCEGGVLEGRVCVP